MKIRIILFLFACVTHSVFGIEDSEFSFTADLTDDTPINKHFARIYGNSTFQFEVISDPSVYAFIVVQVHSHLRDVTLTHMSISINGTNVGLVVQPIQQRMIFIVENRYSVPIDMMAVIVPYLANAPVPGGLHPGLEMSVGQNLITLSAQPALPPPSNSSSTEISYHLYLLHSNEQDFSSHSYFSSLSLMLTVEDIRNSSTEFSLNSNLTALLASYPGTGLVAVVIAESDSKYFAYVPSFTYSCVHDNLTHCEIIESVSMKTIIVCLGFLGIILCWVWPKAVAATEIALFAPFGGTIALFLLYDESDIYTEKYIWICFGVGVTLSIAYIPVRIIKPKLGQHSSALIFSFLIFCILYFFIIGNTFLGHTIYFWLMMPSIIAASHIVLILLKQFGQELSKNTVCVFLFILLFDWIAKSSIKYIIFDVARRIRVSQFSDAILFPPFMIPEKTLMGTGLVIIILRLGYRMKAYLKDALSNKMSSEVNDKSPLLP